MKNPFNKDAKDFVIRKICREANVNYNAAKHGFLNNAEWARLIRAAGTLDYRFQQNNLVFRSLSEDIETDTKNDK